MANLPLPRAPDLQRLQSEYSLPDRYRVPASPISPRAFASAGRTARRSLRSRFPRYCLSFLGHRASFIARLFLSLFITPALTDDPDRPSAPGRTGFVVATAADRATLHYTCAVPGVGSYHEVESGGADSRQ